MAVIGKSKIVFLDEPTNGLDKEQKRRVWDYLIKIKPLRTIILSTNDLEEAEAVSDKLAIMSQGRVIANDTPRNIKKQYGVGYHLIVEQRRASENVASFDFKDKVQLLDPFKNVKVNEDLSYGSKLVFSIPSDQEKRMPELLKTIEGIPELIVSVEVMTLEDSYVKAVKSAQPAEIEHIHKKKHLRIYNAT
jgi:ABC-type multidrug transport system ATPase subunit